MQDYVIANMMMDVTLDPDELISEFLTAYYKEAAPFVREYMDVMHGSIADTNFCMVRGHCSSGGQLAVVWLSLNRVRAACGFRLHSAVPHADGAAHLSPSLPKRAEGAGPRGDGATSAAERCPPDPLHHFVQL